MDTAVDIAKESAGQYLSPRHDDLVKTWRGLPSSQEGRSPGRGKAVGARSFKKRALQYERAASVATDPDACRMYLDLARQLRVMAEQAEAFERAATLRQGIWWSEANSRE